MREFKATAVITVLTLCVISGVLLVVDGINQGRWTAIPGIILLFGGLYSLGKLK